MSCALHESSRAKRRASPYTMKKYLIIATLGFAIFSVAHFAHAATVLSDNFSSYVNGDIEGQGQWLGCTGVWSVDHTVSGIKQTLGNSSNIGVYRSFTTQNASSGVLTMTLVFQQTGNDYPVFLINGSTGCGVSSNLMAALRINGTTGAQALDSTSGWVTVGTIAAGTNTDILEYDTDNCESRVSVNGGAYSSWYNSQGSAFCTASTASVDFLDIGAYSIATSPQAVINSVLLENTAPSGPSVAFNYPVNGTTTPPFEYLSAVLSNLTSTDQYAVNETTQYGNVTLQGNAMTNTGQYFTRFGYVTPFPIITDTQVNSFGQAGPVSMSSTIVVYDTTTGGYVSTPIASATIQWNYTTYCSQANTGLWALFICPPNATSTLIDNFPIYVQATSTAPVTTPWTGTSDTSIAANPLQDNASTTSFCSQPTNITDWGAGLLYAGCQLLNLAFNPNVSPYTETFLSDQWQSLQTVPPFAGVIGTYNAGVSGLQNFSSATSSGVSIGMLGFAPGNTSTPITLVTLDQTTFENGTGTSQHSGTPTSDAVNFMETYIDAILWVIAGVKIIHIFTA